MKRTYWIKIGLIVGIVLFVVGTLPFGEASKPQAKEWPSIALGATTLKGSFYPVLVALAEQLKKHVNVNATVVTAGSSGAAATLMGKGQLQAGILGKFVQEDAYLGKGTFADKGKQPIRSIMGGHYRVAQYMTRADSGIKTAEDIRGKKFMFLQPGAPGTYNMGYALLDAYGIRNDVTILKWKSTETVCNAIKERLIDVGLSGATKSAGVMELVRTTKIHFIPISKEAQDKICNELYPPFEPGFVTKDSYGAGNPSEDVRTIILGSCLSCRADLPVDLVYEITRVILDYPEEFNKYHPVCREFTNLKTSTKKPIIPFHPGAIKYYKEKGIWGPEEDKINNMLLNKIR
jgi:TRAP transporter TAXI family solute receptor